MATDITFAEFSALLASEPLPDGDMVSDARQAALMAAYLANQYKRGTVLVKCATAPDVKDVNDQLASVFDSPLLKPALMKRIMVTHIDRRPADLVANLTYAPDAAMLTEMDDLAIARHVCAICAEAACTGKEMDRPVAIAQKLFPEANADWIVEKFGPKPSDAHLQQYAGVPRPTIRSPARDYLAGNAPDTTRITVQRSTERDIVSPAFETERASNIGRSDLNGGAHLPALTGSKRFKR